MGRAPDRSPKTGTGTIAAWIALALSIGAALYLLLAPVYMTSVTTRRPGDGAVVTVEATTMLQAQGWWVVVPILLPVAACAVAVAVAGRPSSRVVRASVALVMAAFVLLAGFTIGPYYAPSALMMLVAAVLRRQDPREA